MIGRLTGRIAECNPGRVVLDVQDVGYELQIPLSTFYVLAGQHRTPVSLHVHTHVREDALLLFGFATRGEREAFEELIGISGVGPKLALAILSGIDAAELRQTVERQDRERLQRIPGVGRKTAERVLLELRDRTARRPEAVPVAPAAGGVRADAISALVNLGYTRERADRAVGEALERLGPVTELQSLLRGALSGLVG